MNKEDVNRLARQAGAAVGQVMPDGPEIIFLNCMDVHLFASLVAQQEREQCARVCELTSSDMNPMAHWAANECARLIKTRETQNLWGGVDFDINTKRPWVGLSETDFSAINQSCLTKLQAATSAESILKEKNS